MQTENEPIGETGGISNEPAPLSSKLGIPLLSDNPAPLSSALGIPTLTNENPRPRSLGAAAVNSDTTEAPSPVGPSPSAGRGYAGRVQPSDPNSTSPFAKLGREDLYAGAAIAVMILGPLLFAPHS